jgi:multidrug efflux pump subunit AcrA (membrane-fusion protein)
MGILLAGGGFLLWRNLASRQQPGMQMPPGVPVGLAAVQSGNIQDRSDLLGRLEAQTGVALQPEVSGRVTQIFVAAGDRVSPGAPIALINPDRTEAEFNAASAGVSAAEAAREAASASLRSLQARRVELEAELELRRTEYSRTATLVDQGAQSQQALDVAQRDLDVARASVDAALDEIAAAQASLEQANADLSRAEADAAAASQNLNERTVTAPIEGVVGSLDAKLGDYVTPSSVLTSITENATLDLNLNVPVGERDRLRLGLPVQILAADGTDVAATGNITFISPQTDPNTQTILVKASFNNPRGILQD